MNPQNRKVAVAWLSVASNTSLVVFKVVVGLLIGSVSVISEAIHSGVDLVAAAIALFAVKTSSKPADERHPFGHGKFENLSGTVEAVLIFFAAGWIVYEAVKKLIRPQEIDIQPSLGVAVMAMSAGVNWIVSRMLFRVGKETDSIALQADGWHLRTDVWTSIGVMVGLGLIWLGDRFFPQLGSTLHLIDPIAAIMVAALIVKAAGQLTLKSARDLMDEILPPEEEARIKQTLTTFVPMVRGFHRMRTRKAGATRFIEFHIFVDGKMSVEESHRLSHQIAQRIQDQFPGSSVTVHVEPCSGNCDHGCRAGCLLSEEAQEDIGRRHKPIG